MNATRLNLLLLKAVLPDCDKGRDAIFTIIEEDDPLRMLAMFYIAQTWRLEWLKAHIPSGSMDSPIRNS